MTSEEFSKVLKEKQLTLGSVESFTGGLFAREITRIPGASKFYKGGLVTYATEEKINVLGVSKDIVNRYGVVSKECSYEMALKGQKLLNVDICVSFTGNAGPDVMEGKECGEIYIGISYKDIVSVFPYIIKKDRNSVQTDAVNKAYELILKEIETR